MARRRLRPRRPAEDDEYLDIESDFSSRNSFSERFSGLTGHLFDLVKLAIGICLLPFVYSVTISFIAEISQIQYTLRIDFWAGVVTYLILHLFIWEPLVVYTRGQKIFGACFSFFKPFVKIAPALIPIYTLMVFAVYGVASIFIESIWLKRYVLFLAGFGTVLHLVFSARQERSRKYDFLKANYVFGFSVTYIVNIVILAGLFSLAFEGYSFIHFISLTGEEARQVWSSLFPRIF